MRPRSPLFNGRGIAIFLRYSYKIAVGERRRRTAAVSTLTRLLAADLLQISASNLLFSTWDWKSMEYTTLGRTGLKVSVAGLGCGGFSRLGLGTGKSEADAIGIIRAALDLGVNLFDTAAAYGTETGARQGAARRAARPGRDLHQGAVRRQQSRRDAGKGRRQPRPFAAANSAPITSTSISCTGSRRAPTTMPSKRSRRRCCAKRRRASSAISASPRPRPATRRTR